MQALIQREPLFCRLPSQRELANYYRVTLREARSALDLLAERGWARATRTGYRAVRRHGAAPPAQQVVFVMGTQSGGQFMSYVARGADERCRRLGVVMQGRWVDTADRDEQFARLEREMPGLHIGWLLYQKPSVDVLRRWTALGRQFVLLDSLDRTIATAGVILDHVGAARLATEHLMELGHRRIALAHEEHAMAPIPEGVRQVFTRHELRRSPEHDLLLRAESGDGRNEVDAQIRRWIDRWHGLPAQDRPTAIISYNRRWASIVLSCVRQAGLSVPGDLSIVAVGSKYGHIEEDEHITLACSGSAERMGAEAVDLVRKPGPSDEHSVVLLDARLELPDASAGPPSG